MPERSDPYAILGLPKTATLAEVKAAFRRLAREHHPDANAQDLDAERRFKRIARAYEALGHPSRRGSTTSAERTMYRILAANAEVRERRDQLRHPAYARPELLAPRSLRKEDNSTRNVYNLPGATALGLPVAPSSERRMR